MAIILKQKCSRCKKNYVISSSNARYLLCYDCQKREMEGEIKDDDMKKLFDIPEDLYKENYFLRNIKIAYLRFGKLSDRQIEAFKESVARMKEKKE